MGLVAWELYHIDCYRQWPELPEVSIKSSPRKTQRSHESDKTGVLAVNQNATTTACPQVFAIPELAEEIFLQLDQSDLLCRAQQVCRQWRIIITTTRAIREALFLDSISDIRPWLVKTSTSPVLSTEQPHSWAEDEQLGVSRTIVENPFMPLLSIAEPWPESFTRTEASWRKMLITQPGLSKVFWHINENGVWAYDEIASQGLTMGEFAEGGAIHRICGWSAWRAYDDPRQLKAVKVEMRLRRDRLRELHERCSDTELPEYEVWEEKTGEQLKLQLQIR